MKNHKTSVFLDYANEMVERELFRVTAGDLLAQQIATNMVQAKIASEKADREQCVFKKGTRIVLSASPICPNETNVLFDPTGNFGQHKWPKSDRAELLIRLPLNDSTVFSIANIIAAGHGMRCDASPDVDGGWHNQNTLYSFVLK